MDIIYYYVINIIMEINLALDYPESPWKGWRKTNQPLHNHLLIPAPQ